MWSQHHNHRLNFLNKTQNVHTYKYTNLWLELYIIQHPEMQNVEYYLINLTGQKQDPICMHKHLIIISDVSCRILLIIKCYGGVVWCVMCGHSYIFPTIHESSEQVHKQKASRMHDVTWGSHDSLFTVSCIHRPRHSQFIFDIFHAQTSSNSHTYYIPHNYIYPLSQKSVSCKTAALVRALSGLKIHF